MHNIARASFFSLLLLCLVSCEKQADVSSPRTHSSNGITFQYPGNWKVTEDGGNEQLYYIMVESPGDGIAIIRSFPTDTATDLRELGKEFAEDAAAETPIGTVSASTFTDHPSSDGFEWLKEKFSISLLGETVPHERLHGGKELGGRKLFLIFQGSTDDLAKLKPGFDLISRTLSSTEGGQAEAKAEPAVPAAR